MTEADFNFKNDRSLIARVLSGIVRALSRLKTIRIIPNEPKFFTMYEEVADNLVGASDILEEIRVARSVCPDWEKEIVRIERNGDRIASALYRAEETSFITPFPGVHIRELTTKLDDTLDEVEDAVRKIVHYGVIADEDLNSMLGILSRSLKHVGKGLFLLRNLERSGEELAKEKDSIVGCEHEADDLESKLIDKSYQIDVSELARSNLETQGKFWIKSRLTLEEYLKLRQIEADHTNFSRKRREIAETVERAVDYSRDVFHIIGKIKSEQ